MSHATPHKHFGFTVHFDELEPAGVITMRSSTWEALKAEAMHPQEAREEHVLEALDPDPEAERHVLPAGYFVPWPETAIAPLDPENPQTEPGEDAKLPEEQVAEVPLPEHPAIETQPETPDHEWLRKEAEAKEHHE